MKQTIKFNHGSLPTQPLLNQSSLLYLRSSLIRNRVPKKETGLRVKQINHRQDEPMSEVRGILKKDSANGVEKAKQYHRHAQLSLLYNSLTWDEAKLAETEADKSSTMKINEPKTPFSYGMPPSDEEMEGSKVTTFALGSDSEMSSAHYSSGAEWESSEDVDAISATGRVNH